MVLGARAEGGILELPSGLRLSVAAARPAERPLAFAIVFDSSHGASFAAVVGPSVGQEQQVAAVVEPQLAFGPYLAVGCLGSRPCCVVAGRTVRGGLLDKY